MRRSNRIQPFLLALAVAALALPLSVRAQDWSSGADSAFDLHYNGPSSTDTYHSTYRSRQNDAARARANEQWEEQRAQAALKEQQREAALRRQQAEQAAERAAAERRQEAINQADNLFQQGEAAAQAGEYNVAIEDFRDALNDWPDAQNSAFAQALQAAVADLRELSVLHAYAAQAVREVSGGSHATDAATIDMLINSAPPGSRPSRHAELDGPSIDMAIASPPPGTEAYSIRKSTAEAAKGDALSQDRPRSPGTTRAYKGWEALQAHDWKLAAAWYREALARDPKNQSLTGMVRYSEWAASHAPDPVSRKYGGAGVYKSGTPGPPAEMLLLMDEWAKSNPDLIPPGRSKSIASSTAAAIQSQ